MEAKLGEAGKLRRSQRLLTRDEHKEPTLQEIFCIIVRHIRKAQDECSINFTLAREDALIVIKSLYADAEVERLANTINYNAVTKDLDILMMPSHLHNVHIEWIFSLMIILGHSGRLTLAENLCLRRDVGSREDRFTGAQLGSSKEPDFSVTPKSATFPTLVVESGWSESFPRLRRDKDLWIHGGGGKIQLVLLIKWSSLSGGRVSGLIEVWAGDAMANDQLVQTEVVFPSPPATIAAVQSIKVTRAQLFGGQTLSGCNPADVLEFPINALRELAVESISQMGRQPA